MSCALLFAWDVLGRSWTVFTIIQALGLVFVAVYQKALKLMYVDELLEEVKQVRARRRPDVLLYQPRLAVYLKCYSSTNAQKLHVRDWGGICTLICKNIAES